MSGRMPLGEMFADRIARGHVPVYFLSSWIVQRLAGESEFTLRILPAAFGVLSVWLLFLLVERLAGGRAACVAAALLVVHPELMFVSQLARMYTLLLALSLLTLLLLLRAEARPGRHDGTLLFSLCLVLLATHYSATLFLAAVLVYLLARRRPHWRLARPIGLSLAALIPWLVWAGRTAAPERKLAWLREFGPEEIVGLLLKVAGTVQAFPSRDLLTTRPLTVFIVAGATLAIGAWSLLEDFAKRRLLACLVVVPALVALGVGLAGLPNLAAATRYFIVSVAAQAGLVALCLGAKHERLRGLRIAGLVFLLTLEVAGLVAYFTGHETVFAYRASGWREAAAAISAGERPGEAIFYAGDDEGLVTFQYYRPGHARTLASVAPALEAAAVAQANDPRSPDVLADALGLSAATPGAWVFWTDATQRASADSRRLVAALSSRYAVQESTAARGGFVTHFLPRAPGVGGSIEPAR